MGTCCNLGCDRAARALGRCMGCYRHLRRHGVDRDGFKATERRLARNSRHMDDELEVVALAGLFRAYNVLPL